MKKLLYILFFLLVGLTAIAQDTPPSGLKAINAQFYIHLPDSTIWQQKGTPYNWHRVAKYSELQALGLLYLLKSDSSHYTTRSYFGLNGVKYSDTAAFKKKIDSVSNSGYTTHGYFNKYGLRWIDTVGDIATKYYATHGATNFYGDKILYGGLTANGVSVLKLADNSIGISVQKADLSEYTGMSINSFTVNDNTGYSSFMRSLITYKNTTGGELNIQAPDNSSMSGTNTISWPLNKTGTVALSGDTAGLGAKFTNAPHTWTQAQTFKGNLEVQGSLLYIRPLSGTNPYVYADNSTINAINGAGTNTILLNGNSTTLQYNIGSLIGTLHADNITGNRVWQQPDASGTYALTTDLPGGVIGAGAIKDTTLNKYKNLQDVIDKAVGRANLGLPYSVGSNIRNNSFGSWYGDSFTTGFQGTPAAIPVSTQFEQLTGMRVYNYGIGGQTSAQIYARWSADTVGQKLSNVIWWGYNNLLDTATVKANILAAVNTMKALGNTKYVVLSIMNKRDTSQYVGHATYNIITGLNSWMDSKFPGHYIDIRSILVSSFNPAIPQDVIDHAHDVPPFSLHASADSLHLNTAGYAIVAQTLSANIHMLQDSNTYILTKQNARDLFKNVSQYSVGVGGKYMIGGQQVLSLPDQSIYTGTLIGGQQSSAMSHVGTNDARNVTVFGLSNSTLLTTGFNITSIGAVTGANATSAFNIVSVGNGANQNLTSANSVVAVGPNANQADLTGSFVALVGNGAGAKNLASSQTGIGSGVLANVTTGTQNFGGGTNALNVYTGSGASGTGYRSLASDVSGTALVGNGFQTYANGTGSRVVAIGYNGAIGIAGNSAESDIVVIGPSAGANMITGSDSTIAIGSAAASTLTSGSGIFIGHIQPQSITTKHQLSIGNAIFGTGINGNNTTVSLGNIGFFVANPTARVHFPAGKITAGFAPIKFGVNGVVLATPEAMAFESTNLGLFFTDTISTVKTRREVILDTKTQTLTNKTLTSPQINSPLLNTTSVIGQVWTATNTVGAGGWATASVPNRSHTLFAPTTGGTVNTVVDQDNIVNPSGALATLTINLPSSPSNNAKVFLTFTQAVTAISYTGGTVVGVPLSASLGSQWFLTYDTGTATWY